VQVVAVGEGGVGCHVQKARSSACVSRKREIVEQ